jgi:hypothetical protein
MTVLNSPSSSTKVRKIKGKAIADPALALFAVLVSG